MVFHKTKHSLARLKKRGFHSLFLFSHISMLHAISVNIVYQQNKTESKLRMEGSVFFFLFSEFYFSPLFFLCWWYVYWWSRLEPFFLFFVFLHVCVEKFFFFLLINGLVTLEKVSNFSSPHSNVYCSQYRSKSIRLKWFKCGREKKKNLR